MAAGDLALTILIGANDIASPVIRGVAASVMGLASSGFASLKNAVGNLAFGFKNLGTAGTVGMDAIKAGAMDALAGLAALAGVALLVGAAIAVAIGVVSVHAAADFQQGLNRLVTGAGDVTDNMQKMGQGILGVSVATGILTSGTDGLNAAMYQVISSGQRGAQALTTLKAAAQGAQIEQANVVDVTKILTTLQTNFGLSTYTATQYMNGLVAAVAHGKITLEDLSTAMSPILPQAKELGIHFADVAAAMSDMTNQGIPADQAAQALRFTMQSMILPTKGSQAAMKEWGLDSTKVAAEMKVSLPVAIQMYIDAAKRAGPEGSKPFIDALSAMMGGGQRAAKALFSLSQSMGTWRTDISLVNAALGNTSKNVAGWEVAQGNLNLVVNQGKAALQALLIIIGTALLPVITKIAAEIGPLISRFGDWLVKSNALGNAIKTVTPFFATMFDTVRAGMAFILPIFATLIALIARLVQWVTANKTAMEAFRIIAIALGVALLVGLVFVLGSILLLFAAVSAAVIAVVGVVMLLIIAAKWLAGAWNSAVAWIGGAWHTLEALAVSVFNAVKNAIVTAFNATIAWIVNAWHAAIAFIVSIWRSLVAFASSVFNAVKSAIMSAVQSVVTWLVNAWHNAVATVVGWFVWLYNHNIYFFDLVNIIRMATQAIVSWLVTAWQNCVNFIASAWSTLTGLASAAWGAVSSIIMSVVQAVVSWLVGAWNSAIAWLGGAWNTLAGLASSLWSIISSAVTSATSSAVSFLQGAWSSAAAFLSGVWSTIKQAVVDAWNFIVAQFAAAWGRISGPLNSLGSSIKGFFSNLAAQAVAWGSNIIRGIADGINGAIGWVKTAASNVAAAITGILGFHRSTFTPPSEGPASGADRWAPALVSGFAEGLIAGVPQMHSAIGQLLSPLSALERPLSTQVGTTGSTFAGGRYPTGGGTTVINQITVESPSITLDGAEVTNKLGKRFAREIRVQGAIRSR